jgi:hypothetical protein
MKTEKIERLTAETLDGQDGCYSRMTSKVFCAVHNKSLDCAKAQVYISGCAALQQNGSGRAGTLPARATRAVH